MAADLVRRRVAVIVTTGASPSLLAARGATREIPTVLISGEPMQDGIVVSFNRPGRNATGVSLFTKASAPYEFGVKASVVTTNARAPGGQFVLHARTLPGNPYDGHTLGAVIEATERLTGREIERAYVDKGYRGHDAPNPRRVFISGP